MAEQTGISWCDSTFNPWIGCTHVGPGCDHCYAEALMDHRMRKAKWGSGETRVRTSTENWGMPLRWGRDHALFAANTGRRRRVFCASLCDVFDNDVDPTWRADLFRLIASTPNLDWLLLTKRIGNVARMVAEVADMPRHGSHAGHLSAHHWRNGTAPQNVWLGITVVNQADADRDIPKLLDIPARVRFLSVEPMLGPINIRPINRDKEKWEVDCLKAWTWEQEIAEWNGTSEDWEEELADWYGVDEMPSGPMHNVINWVICGGESGPHARPMDLYWARSLRDQCADAGVPFLFKQAGGAGRDKGGCLLDGVGHKSWPKVPPI